MFNLFRSRAKSVRILLGALLGMVALMMVVTLIPGGWGGGGGGQDRIVAEVGDEVITVDQVQQRVRMITRNRQIPRELAEAYVPQIVESLVNERVMAYEARRLGFAVTPDDLARGLHMLVPVLFQGGQFIGKEAYARLLQEQNLTIPQFEENVRLQMLGSKLEEMVAQGVLVSPDEIVRAYERLNEKVKLEYAALTPDKFRSQVSVSPEEIQKQYEAQKATFRIPEKRSLQMLVVDQAKVAARTAAPEQELRRLYAVNREDFRMPERVHVRHILLKTADKPPAEVAKLQQKAEDLVKQLKAGGDFAELAKKNSEDTGPTGSAAKGGDLGWIVRGQTVKNFENTAFSLAPKQLSGAIATEYGIHILQAIEKEPARLKPFEEVKDALAAEWKTQRVADAVERLADQAHVQLVKNPAGAGEIARQLDLDVVKADKIGAGDPAPELGVNPDFAAAIERLPRGGVAPVMDTPGNKKVIAVVTEVFPARPAELSEVESQIRSALTQQKLTKLVEAKARELAEKAKAAGGDLQKAAQSLGLEVKTTQEFSREGAADGIGPASVVMQAFNEPAGGVFGPVPMQDSRFVCKVVGKVPADPGKLTPEQRASIENEIRSRKSRARVDLFQDSLRTALLQQKKIKIHGDAITRIVDGFRG